MSFLPKDLLKEHGFVTPRREPADLMVSLEESLKGNNVVTTAPTREQAEEFYDTASKMIADDAPDTRSRRGYTITKVQRDGDGFWTARVTNGQTYTVDRKHGSWQVVEEVDGQERRREVLPDVAAALQAKVRPVEARERKAREAAEEAARLAAKKPNTKETKT